MSEDLVNELFKRLSKVFIRMSLATLLVVIVVAVFCALRVSVWEKKLDHAWLDYDMQEYTWQMKLSNSNLVVPDSYAIKKHRLENERQ
jgi:hypothetical protein